MVELLIIDFPCMRYVALISEVITDDKLERMWNEAVVAHFKVEIHFLDGLTKTMNNFL
jgi:hypothetical protein